MKMSASKTRLSFVASIMGALTMAAGSVYAAKDKPMMMDRNKVDLNGNGMVSEAEIVTYVRMFFIKMDKDNDQMLSQSEWDTYHHQ